AKWFCPHWPTHNIPQRKDFPQANLTGAGRGLRFSGQGGCMTKLTKRALIVGLGATGAGLELVRLERRGWKCRAIETLREAGEAIRSGEFGVVLAAEQLADGWGYDLMDCVAEKARTLLVMVNLSESCLWLPVVVRGMKALGERALHPGMLEWEMEGMVFGPGGSRTRVKSGRKAGRSARAKTKRERASQRAHLWGGELGMQPR